MICKIGHEILTEAGFKVYESGVDYPPEEAAGREKYFEKEAVKAAAVEENLQGPETGKPPQKAENKQGGKGR